MHSFQLNVCFYTSNHTASRLKKSAICVHLNLIFHSHRNIKVFLFTFSFIYFFLTIILKVFMETMVYCQQSWYWKKVRNPLCYPFIKIRFYPGTCLTKYPVCDVQLDLEQISKDCSLHLFTPGNFLENLIWTGNIF